MAMFAQLGISMNKYRYWLDVLHKVFGGSSGTQTNQQISIVIRIVVRHLARFIYLSLDIDT